MPNQIPDGMQTEEAETAQYMLRTFENIPPTFFRDNNPHAPSSFGSLTEEDIGKLQIASDKIRSEERARRDEMQIPTDDRENRYIENIFETKRSNAGTPQAIMESDVPICLGSLEYDTIQQIIDKHRVANIYSNDNRMVIECASCKRTVPSQYAYFLLGMVYCAEHVPDVRECARCSNLATAGKEVVTHAKQNVFICSQCVKRNRCVGCSIRLTDEHIVNNNVCLACFERQRSRAPFKTFDRGIAWIGQEAGKIVKSLRVFSAEIETFTPNENDSVNLYTELPKEMGLSRDESIRQNNGIELQTPKLAGARGEELVYKVESILKNVDAKVDSSCGLHIHLDGKGLMVETRKDYPRALIQMWKAHLVFEDVILSFIPFNRRKSKYARPMRPYFNLSELDTVETIAEAEKLWYRVNSYPNVVQSKGHQHHSSRYFGINLHPLFAQGHMEVRYHPGTTNADKILQWANLHALILDAAVKGVFTRERLTEISLLTSLKDKTKALFELIELAGPSRKYFFERQHKFANQQIEEDGQAKSSPRIVINNRRPEWVGMVENFHFQEQALPEDDNGI